MTKLISFSQLASDTWALFREKFLVLFGLLVIPFLLFIVSPLLSQVEDFFSLSLSLILTLLAGLALAWSGAAAIIVLHHRADQMTIKGALNKAKGKFWPLVWVAILVCFIVMGSSFLFLIPGLILAVYFIFAKIIVITEGELGMRALAKSREYVRNYFWPIVGRLLVIAVAVFLISFVLNWVLSFLVQLLGGGAVASVILLVLRSLINAIIFSLLMVATYLLYRDVREVKGEINLPEGRLALKYLWLSLVGWFIVIALFVLSIIVFTTAIGGYLLGAFVTDIFNNQALIQATSTIAQ